MSEIAASALGKLRAGLATHGFVFAPAANMQALLLRHGSLDDWPRFAGSWDDLAPDTYLAGHGRYRRRRYAVYEATASAPHEDRTIVRAAHQPHFQSREYNALQGGIERWFEPIHADIGDGSSMRTVLRFCLDLFGALAPRVPRWHIEVHQFRIEARRGEPGQPTPEGIHRDGVDHVLVLMVRRSNIAEGTTTIHAPDGRLLGSFTLAEPFDAALVDDHRVYHGVTPVEAVDPLQPAFRDVLVVTFRADRG